MKYLFKLFGHAIFVGLNNRTTRVVAKLMTTTPGTTVHTYRWFVVVIATKKRT